MTNNGISHIQWHPSSSHLILAAADKSGNVGLWNLASQKKASQGRILTTALHPIVQILSCRHSWMAFSTSACIAFDEDPSVHNSISHDLAGSQVSCALLGLCKFLSVKKKNPQLLESGPAHFRENSRD